MRFSIDKFSYKVVYKVVKHSYGTSISDTLIVYLLIKLIPLVLPFRKEEQHNCIPRKISVE